MKKNLFVGTACAAFAMALAQDTPHWSYQGRTGAANWGSLDPSFQECKLGKHQSPINIETKKVKPGELGPVGFAYKPVPAEVVNNGHTILVNLKPGSSIRLGGTDYPLVQFHFHTPSEELIDGKPYAMVAHLVHKTADGKLAAVAVLIKEGKENAALKPVFDSMPPKEGQTTQLPAAFDPAGMLPADHAYYAYEGSLTTPPCSEVVVWRVLKTPIEVSRAQHAAFRKIVKMNARPVQPLNDRVVESGG